MLIKRILMNAADQGGASGNPAIAAPASAPVEVPQAQGDTVTISKVDLEALVSGAVTKAVGEVKGSIYAEARRTFTEGKKPAKSDEVPDKTGIAQPQIDPFKMRGLDFALNKLGLSPDLNQTQYERAHRDFASDSPADAEAWARDYFHGHAKLATPAPAQPATPAATPKPIAEQPVSSRGTPPSGKVSMEELDLPSASDADRQSFIKQKGMKVYVDTLRRQLKGRTATTR